MGYIDIAKMSARMTYPAFDKDIISAEDSIFNGDGIIKKTVNDWDATSKYWQTHHYQIRGLIHRW